MEPERNIEKELKAYAQQRRAEAGAQPELHPATRNLLQDEAARLAKAADAETKAAGGTFWDFWPRLAVGGVAVMAVVAGCWIMLRGSSANKMEMARNREIPKMGPVDRLKTENKAAETRRSLAAAKSDSAVTAVDSLKLNSAPAPAPASPAATASLGVPPPVATPFAGTLKDSTEFGGISGTAATAPKDKFYALYPADVPVTPVIQRFRSTSQVASRSGDSGGTANVLATFSVEEAQDRLRMIDSDGSVYLGFVSRTPKAAREPVEGVKKALAQNSTAAETQRQPLNLFSFRVSGTNRTLKQEVVFTGDFLTAAEIPVTTVSGGELVATNAPLLDGAGGAGETVLPLELQKVRLEGRVLVDRTNNIEIKAAPVKP